MFRLYHPLKSCKNSITPNVYNRNNSARICYQLIFRNFSTAPVTDTPLTIDNSDAKTATPPIIRNVAIVAHVDHGKTTLVNQLLHQNFASSLLMDNLEIEQERGITISSKITRLEPPYSTPTIINAVDTPGHVDFSGEVDRILSIVDGIALVVDPKEGIKSQTRYVVEKAMTDRRKRMVLVLNKCDVPEGWEKVGLREGEILDLLDNLGCSEEQMDFETVYASGKGGWFTTCLDVGERLSQQKGSDDVDENDDVSMTVLTDAILRNIPPPLLTEGEERLGFAVATISNDVFLGKMATGRMYSGTLRKNDGVRLLPRESRAGDNENSQISNLSGIFIHRGVDRQPFPEGDRVYPGDIVTLGNVPAATAVGDTLTSKSNPLSVPLPTPSLPRPTLSVIISANNSPRVGKDGSKLTFNAIWERLSKEVENNISISIEKSPDVADAAILYGRGTLQLGTVLEMMRREQFELTLSPPSILTVTDEADGSLHEPYEELVVEIDDVYTNAIMNNVTSQEGLLVDMHNDQSKNHSMLTFHIPTRRLLDLNLTLTMLTKGTAVIHHRFLETRPTTLGKIRDSRPKRGKLVSNATGTTTAFALANLTDRGRLFVSPGDEVYPGMVIGERTDQQKNRDLEVNPLKAKKLDNMRTQAKDEKILLEPPRTMSLEEVMGYLDDDEVLELTPKGMRIRKKELDARVRERLARSQKKQKQ